MLKDVPSSVEDILALGQDDPEYAAWKKKQTAMPNDLFSDIATLRAASEPSMQKSFEALGNPGQLLHIPMRDGFQSTVRLYRPKSQLSTKRSPLVVLLFGGGFVSGDNRQLAAFAVALASIYGAVVALPDYRLAPEHPFPAAQNDVWDSLTHLASNTESLKLEPSAGFILGGVSAGGNIAAALSQKWINEGITPKLTGMWLSIPLLFESSEFVPEEYKRYYLAREQNKDSLGVNERALQWINHYQKPNPGSPLYSPFNSSSLEGHRNVAKGGTRVYFQIAGGDPLRDDGMIYERVLRDVGVDTKLDLYPGVPHGHFAQLPFLQSSQRANQDTIRQFSWLLREGAPSENLIQQFYAAPGGA